MKTVIAETGSMIHLISFLFLVWLRFDLYVHTLLSSHFQDTQIGFRPDFTLWEQGGDPDYSLSHSFTTYGFQMQDLEQIVVRLVFYFEASGRQCEIIV